jgi:hypothetical protein
MINTKKSDINKLYEDAVLLHQIHTEHSVQRDHFLRYWEPRDQIN